MSEQINDDQNTVQQVGNKYFICNIVAWRMYNIKFSLVFFDKIWLYTDLCRSLDAVLKAY